MTTNGKYMIRIGFMIIAIGFICSCTTKKNAEETFVIKIDTLPAIDTPAVKPLLEDEPAETINKTPFNLVVNFAAIKDSAKFIEALVKGYLPDIDYEREKDRPTGVTVYKKIRLAGAKKELIFLEYDYRDGSMASYPWKCQLVFDLKGNCIKIFSAQRFEFLKIFPDSDPLLITVIATSKGNGGHEIYKMSGDTLENIYDGYIDYKTQTYDAHEDNTVFEPNELKLTVHDYNEDGVNDIIFSGKMVVDQGSSKPFKIIPVKFIFLYNKKTGHFEEKEDYEKKYEKYYN